MPFDQGRCIASSNRSRPLLTAFHHCLMCTECANRSDFKIALIAGCFFLVDVRLCGICRLTTYDGVVHQRLKPLGDVDTSIMAVLADGDLHGYAILADVRDLGCGGVRLGTGTLYGALERLQDNGSVLPVAEDVVDGRTRRYYRLTDLGRTALVSELERRQQLLNAARNRLAGAT